MENDSHSNDESDLRRRFCAATAETKRLATEVMRESEWALSRGEETGMCLSYRKIKMWWIEEER